jgi:hypothetical protein
MVHRHAGIVLLVFCAYAASRPVSAEDATLAEVLSRAAAYVSDFNRELSGIVAEERYVQTWTRDRGRSAQQTTRRLVSDLMLVRPASSSEWVQYRDVFEVDGVPVRDRHERLTRLFLQPSPSADAQMARIQEESARHNLGDLPRTLNTPLFALQLLGERYQSRFRFKRTGDRASSAGNRGAGDTGAFRVSTEIWVVQYEEVHSPTVIGTADSRDVPARGRFWIEPAAGRVLMTELIVGDRDRNGQVDVSYQSEPLLGLLVPIEMRERYEERRNRSRIDAVATYGRFRQFQVQVTEEVATPSERDAPR